MIGFPEGCIANPHWGACSSCLNFDPDNGCNVKENLNLHDDYSTNCIICDDYESNHSARINHGGNMNTWPGGKRHAMSQSEHAEWNAKHFPGTRQLCETCGEPTGRCEEDSLYADEDGEIGPLCEACWEEQRQDL